MYLLFQKKFNELTKEERLLILIDLLKTCGSRFILPIPENETFSG